MYSISRIAAVKVILIVNSFLNPTTEASESGKWEDWIGTYSCEDCGPKGSSTADKKGPTPCWNYTIKVQRPESDFGQGKVEIQISGFQTSDDFSSQAVIKGDRLDVILLPKSGNPIVHLFQIKKSSGPRLLFKGLESNTNNSEISCNKK